MIAPDSIEATTISLDSIGHRLDYVGAATIALDSIGHRLDFRENYDYVIYSNRE